MPQGSTLRITIILPLFFTLSYAVGFNRFIKEEHAKSNVPEWKQKACQKASNNIANIHYTCDEKGNLKCLPGWQGDLCQVPMCRRGCDPMNGYCQRPGECRCRIGYEGELCDKCIPLPGCQHGYCTKPFECLCKQGWDGLFCTEPACREGCHSTRGYCEGPNECRCRIGWTGRNCTECAVMPGCQFGVCKKPLECQCLSGYTGLLCQTPICASNCHKQHGYCRKPDECRCKVGWMGPNCSKCFPYPGCVNGDCEQPWECNCKSGWGGMLCDEPLTYCNEHENVCKNGGSCVSLTAADGSFRCQCLQGYLGRNCEIVDEFLLTSTTAPRITPPPLPEPVSDEEDVTEIGSKDASNKFMLHSNTTRQLAIENLKINEVQNINYLARPITTTTMPYVQENVQELKNSTLVDKKKDSIENVNVTSTTEAIKKFNNSKDLLQENDNNKFIIKNKVNKEDEEYDEEEYDYDDDEDEDEGEEDAANNET